MAGRLLALAITGFLVMITIAVTGGPGVIAEPPPGGCLITPASTPPAGGTTSATQKSADLDAAQMAAARTIAAVGKHQGIAERGIAIALSTAMQESTLNPAAVNGRSVGLFQQQGQLYAGIDRTDPAAAAAAFYRILTERVPTYAEPSSGTFADIAQEVQRSGAGASKYAPWESWATALARQLVAGPATPIGPGLTPTGGSESEQQVVCEPGGGPGPIHIDTLGARVTLPARAGIAAELVFPNPAAATAAAAALSYLGTPYAWGGGGPDGPTKGIRDGGVADAHGDYAKVGFDCSGLTEYAYAQAGIPIGGDSRTQRVAGGTAHPYRDALPGDLLFWGGPSLHNIHHVALYLGVIDGTAYMIEAPSSGDVVKVSPVRTGADFRHEAVRPWR